MTKEEHQKEKMQQYLSKVAISQKIKESELEILKIKPNSWLIVSKKRNWDGTINKVWERVHFSQS